ncbi:MAG: DmsE family decaheme c-type cytochrome [Acidobacteria bacterium]|nr:DmsE family decaheme c-type cytochrome [Acidobacteriota bacterium]
MGKNLATSRNGAKAIGLLCLFAAIVFFLLSPGKSQAASSATVPQAQGEYVGSETCRGCHPDQFEGWKNTAMGRAMLDHPQTDLEKRACEACHGPGRAHAEGGGDVSAILRFGKESTLSAEDQNAQCLQCHEKGARLFWEGSTHDSRGLTCVTCHLVMKPNVPSLRFNEPLTGNRQFVQQTRMEVCFQCHLQRRAQVYRSAHMPFREGKVTCTDCHNPHGTPNPKLLIESTTNETCYKCHAERRGPFLWEHPPVMENCANCHDPHGTTRPQMLKVSAPRLCQQCHIEARHPTTPQLATQRFAFNRGCTNCHSQIHGSNNPSGVRFHR